MDYFDDEFAPEAPDLHETIEDRHDPTENGQKANDPGETEDLTDVAAVTEKKRKAVSRRVLLDPEKLCGNRGLDELKTQFARVKFRGKGHEFDDLNTMMAKLEYWAHLLCPKMPFDEVLEKIETFGSKRVVRTALMNLRPGNTTSTTDDGAVAVVADIENDHVPGADDALQQESMAITKAELTEEQRKRIEENKRQAQNLLQRKNEGGHYDEFDELLINDSLEHDGWDGQQSDRYCTAVSGSRSGGNDYDEQDYEDWLND